MNEITLSYIITTRNKLPFLKEVMKRLLTNIQEDEEIIVVDAVSTDGTVEYLTDLYNQGKIHHFISEPDRGEAHGYNKGFLMARGKLLKDITDDDAFYYPAIQECKKFMLEYEEVDVMSGNSAEVNLEELEDLNGFKLLTDSERNYKKWLETGRAVSFIGLPLMIRKKSLALTGFYSTGMIQVDTDYSLRITNLNVNIAWNTAVIAVRIANPKSNFRSLFSGKIRYLEERNRCLFFYDEQYRKTYYKEMLRSYLRPIKASVIQIFSRVKKENKSTFTDKVNGAMITNAFNICDRFMEEYNSKNMSKILVKS